MAENFLCSSWRNLLKYLFTVCLENCRKTNVRSIPKMKFKFGLFDVDLNEWLGKSISLV